MSGATSTNIFSEVLLFISEIVEGGTKLNGCLENFSQKLKY